MTTSSCACGYSTSARGSRSRTETDCASSGNPDSRVFAYDVVIVGDDPKARLFKSVYFEGCNVAPGHEPNNGITEDEIPVAELPAGKNLTIAVRPVSSLGTKGRAVGTEMRV